MQEHENLLRPSRTLNSLSNYLDPDIPEYENPLLQELLENVILSNNSRVEELLSECENLEIINIPNKRGMTLLHFACDKSDPATVKLLITAGADVNWVDGNGRTPLHWTLEGRCHCQFCSQNNAKCIELLRQSGANLDVEDRNGETALHYAAKNMLPKCAIYLLDNGAKITSTSPRAANVGYLMVQKIPESVARILDRGIIFDERDNSRLKLDFGLLLQTNNTFLPGNSLQDVSNDCQIKIKETALLVQMLRAHRSGREILLTHPLVEAFLHLKWLAVRKWFWLVRLAYGLLIIIYSLFIFDIYIWSCPWANPGNSTKASSSNVTMGSNTSILGESTSSKIEMICGSGTNPWILSMTGFILISIIFMTLNEIFEYFNNTAMYLSTYLNFSWWVLIFSMILTVLPAFGLKPRIWQYPLAAFSLFYAWAMNLTQIGRIPYFGDYIEMLGKVLKDFGIFLMTYSSLMIAFTLGFCIMFPENAFFRNLPLAYVKILLMMIGEPDYELLFEENERMDSLAYAIPAHIIYMGFIFVVTIVLMNLLLGLAVSDIQELRKHSSLTRATRQIKQIALLEAFIYSSWLPPCLSRAAVENISVRNGAAKAGNTRCDLCFAPMDHDDDQLPEDLKQKFVPYLTKSPCLTRPVIATKRKFFGTKYGRNQSNFSKVALEYKNRPKEFRQMFILKSLAESVEELKAEVNKIAEKVNALGN